MLLTTHYMDEADVLGDRVGIMNLAWKYCEIATNMAKSMDDSRIGMSPKKLKELTVGTGMNG